MYTPSTSAAMWPGATPSSAKCLTPGSPEEGTGALEVVVGLSTRLGLSERESSSAPATAAAASAAAATAP